jgi:cation transport regulator ChaC
MKPNRPGYIFGYGSLLGDRADNQDRRAEPLICHLHGYRRTWNVAMDNRRTLPGYKYYIDPQTGERPAIFVTFLNLVPNRSQLVNGVLFPVDPDQLEVLDDRERNYERHEVTDNVSEHVAGQVWVYIGTPDSEDRFREGQRSGQAVVSREYIDGVYADFRLTGEQALREFEASTDEPGCPIVDLVRVDVE